MTFLCDVFCDGDDRYLQSFSTRILIYLQTLLTRFEVIHPTTTSKQTTQMVAVHPTELVRK